LVDACRDGKSTLEKYNNLVTEFKKVKKMMGGSMSGAPECYFAASNEERLKLLVRVLQLCLFCPCS
jgi:hypothetical protein